MGITFHIPSSSIGDENQTSAQVFCEKLMGVAVAAFDGIAILTPRGQYKVELHHLFLRLQGQANEFKIQYSSVDHIFLLPELHVSKPHTFVIVTLKPPIRKDQTSYAHIVFQFKSGQVVDIALTMNEDLLNVKYKDKLEPKYKGPIHIVFSKILSGLSGAKATWPEEFITAQGLAVKSSVKAENGFSFLLNPPALILFDEILTKMQERRRSC